jgi:hypothetical protein
MASDNIHRMAGPARRHIRKGTENAVRTQTGTQAGLHGGGAAGSRRSAPDNSHPCIGARCIRALRSGVRSPHVAAGRRRRIARNHIARNHIARSHIAHSHIGRSRMTGSSDSRLRNSTEAELDSN